MNIIGCPICMGKGFAIVRKQNYDFKHHCTCRFGDSHKYEGRECSKHQTDYYCASIDTLPSGTIDALIADNQKRYDIKKVGDRWMKPEEHNLTQDQVKEMKAMAWAMMKVSI